MLDRSAILLLFLFLRPSSSQVSNNFGLDQAWNFQDEDGNRIYDARLDPSNEKFDCRYWWDHVMANPGLYHEQWRPFHDPDDRSDIFNAGINHPSCQFSVWYKMKEWETGNFPWEERRPRPDPYYTRPVVNTDYGIIRGYNVTWERRPVFNKLFPKEEFFIEKSISIFLGIPYAGSPDRQSRFQRADFPQVWAPKELDASRFRNACVQIDEGAFIGKFQPNISSNYSEDCLYLNVFAPNYTYPRTMKEFAKWRPTDQNYPVLVFFHGGDFVKGSASLYPGHMLASKDIIVVTVNYRLGPLGFLSTGTKDAPGNYGLWDQWRALQWVNENIHYFFGDPNRVTIMGEEAGAISALLHTYSEWSRPYFHQVIAHGASEFTPGAVTLTQYLYDIEANRPNRPSHFAEELAELLGCAIPTEQDRLYEEYYEYALRQMRDCLKDWQNAATWENIAKVSKFVGREPDNPPWHPVVDEFLRFPFLDALPRQKADAIKANVLKSEPKPVIFGLDADTGADFIERLNVTGLDEGLDEQEFTDIVMNFVTERNKRYVLYDETHGPNPAIIHYDRLRDAVAFTYTNWQNRGDNRERLQRAVDMVTDYYTTAPIVESLGVHGRFNATWLYVFDYRSELSTEPAWKGVPSGKAMEYAFGYPFYNYTEDPRWVFWDHLRNFDRNFRESYDDVDRNVSNITMELIATFVKHGRPTLLRPDVERETPLGFKWNNWDDFMTNLTWPQYQEGKHHLTINRSLHHPYNCSLDYVFQPEMRIGDSSGKFGENRPIIVNWAQWNDFISELQKWRLTQSDYEQGRTRFSCWRRYRERQLIVDNSQNFREHQAGFWNGYYAQMSVRNISLRHLEPTPRPAVAYMSPSVYQGIVFTLVAILFILCVAAISICLCPRRDSPPGGSRGSTRTDKDYLRETMLDGGGGGGGGEGLSREMTRSSISSKASKGSRMMDGGGVTTSSRC